MVLDMLDETPREHYSRKRETIDGWNAKVFQPFFVCGQCGDHLRAAFALQKVIGIADHGS